MLTTWTSLLGPELGPRVAGAKGLAALLAFIGVVVLGMAAVVGGDSPLLTAALGILAVLLLVIALVRLLSIRRVATEVVRRLAASGVAVRRPPLLVRSAFEEWRGEHGMDAAQLVARL